MTTQETLAANETSVDTGTTANDNSQAQSARTYTEEEFNNHIAGLKASLTKKLLKPYEELGDVNELRELKQQAQQRAQEEQMKKGQFETILQELAQKKDQEISKRDQVIREYKIDSPLLNAAAKYRSVNPEQVRTLLKGQLNLNQDGEVEVLDNEGRVRYNDAGKAIQVEDLVKEWLDANPHFVASNPATSATKSSISAPTNSVDISKLNMQDPEHRKVYAAWRKENGIR